jgi:hypothetical protein
VRDQLEDDRGHVVLLERLRHLVRVVEAAHDRRVEHLGQDPLRERVLLAHALGGRDHVHRDRVVPAVVAALELDHVAAAGRRARDAERVEGRLAPGRREEHLLERRDVVDELLRHLDLDLADPDPHQVDMATNRGDSRIDICVVVAEDWRSEGGVVVREDAPVPVGEGRAARRGDDEVLEPGDLALAAVDAAGDDCRGPRCEPGLGFRCGRAHRRPPSLSCLLSPVDSEACEHVLVEIDAEARLRRHRDAPVGVER